MTRGGMARWIAALLVCWAAVGVVDGGAPAVSAQPAGCVFSGRSVDAATDRPIQGMRKTLLETGESVLTDAEGRWSFRVPGAGTYTVESTHPSYQTSTRRYELDDRCAVIDRTDVPNGTPPTTAPPVGPPPGTVHRITGTLTLEGRPAPAGTRVVAFVGEAPCGEARVGRDGRYSIDVLPIAARADCARADARVQLGVRPAFGETWRLGSEIAFRAGTSTQRDLAWDPRRHRADPGNVPWIPITWAQPQRIAIGICEEMSPESEEATIAAFDQWRDAHRDRGLLVELVADGEEACSRDAPGIVVIEDTLDERRALAGAGHIGANGRSCRRNVPCDALKSIVVINGPTFAQLDAEERANVLAHEIGHALGLDHARACTGGTIMWEDTRCRFPMTVIGADDIASLNEKVAGGPATKLDDPDAELFFPVADETSREMVAALRPSSADALASLPSSTSLLANGSVTTIDKVRPTARAIGAE